MPKATLKPEEEGAQLEEARTYRTTYMFSATMPPAVERLARKYLRRCVSVCVRGRVRVRVCVCVFVCACLCCVCCGVCGGGGQQHGIAQQCWGVILQRGSSRAANAALRGHVTLFTPAHTRTHAQTQACGGQHRTRGHGHGQRHPARGHGQGE
jgi:hypothetical protein